MTVRVALVVASLAAACGGSSTAPYRNPFAGTCLEPLFACFQGSGQGRCSYNRTTSVATLTYPNGAKVTSGSGGTQDNEAFGPSGVSCFTVTKNSATAHSYRGQGLQGVVVIDDGSGTLQVQCPNGTQTVRKPAQNPAEEDLSACATP